MFSGLTLLPALPALAQTFPAKSVRIIVPYSPGGTTDLLARIVGQKLGQAWGVPVVVDNRPGANGIVGTEIVAKAPPDGHTLSIASVGTHGANASMYPTLPYDTIKDFAPVTLAVNAPMLLVAHPTLPVKNVKESEVPTIAEAGVPGYESNAWYGFVTTAGTPKEVVAKLNADIVKAMNAPDSKERLSGVGVIIVGNSPEHFAAFIKTEMDKAARVVKAANIKAD